MADDSKKPKEQEEENPLDENLEDELLDAALGLDQLDVTDSEVMGQTGTTKVNKKKKVVEKMIGIDHVEDEASASSAIGSVNMEEKSGEIKKADSPPPKAPSKTGKLDILSDHDQFGLGDESLLEGPEVERDHDYDWFVKEMKSDITKATSGGPGEAPAKADTKAENLDVTDTSAQIERVSVPGKKSSGSGKAAGKKSGGVDKFIEDFKKEVESFGKEESKQAIDSKSKVSAAKSADPLENMSAEQFEAFKRQFVADLAAKVAEKIVSKIDSQKLRTLLKNEMSSKSRNPK
jgi:hypothetical protein